jgi:malate dehydrogenase (quinone)
MINRRSLIQSLGMISAAPAIASPTRILSRSSSCINLLQSETKRTIVLIGAGIMSATLATYLNNLDPTLTIIIIETLNDCGQESSNSWNNAGTGHAGNCELNYTPIRNDGSIDISKALEINIEFDYSRQLWSYLVNKGDISTPSQFINPCPHVSFVWAEDVPFLKQRYSLLSKHHCFRGMNYSQNYDEIMSWVPLVMEGRDKNQIVAATRIDTGSDVDFGALTHLMMQSLAQNSNISILYNRKASDLRKNADNKWIIQTESSKFNEKIDFIADFVFVAAGGNSIELLQKSKIPEGKGYAGFPVSGIWLRNNNTSLSNRHHAKVYGKAPIGSPPMSVPHLDLRVVNGIHSLLFGPFAGFSTKFLHNGSYTDLFRSVDKDNIVSLLSVAKDNWRLSEYLISQSLQSSSHQFSMLQQYFPMAKKDKWIEATAGQRVMIIRPDRIKGGELEFGTELVFSADKSFVALLGASPGASTAAYLGMKIIESSFCDNLTPNGWLPVIKKIIPTYGIDLKLDQDACKASRTVTASTLGLRDI